MKQPWTRWAFRPPGGIQHVALAHQLLRAGGVQNDAGLQRRGHGEGNAAGDIGLHQAGDHVGGGPLGGDDQVHPGGAAHLGHPADGFLHLLGRHQHQVRQLVDDHHHGGHFFSSWLRPARALNPARSFTPFSENSL